jgi:hypothetical protein
MGKITGFLEIEHHDRNYASATSCPFRNIIRNSLCSMAGSHSLLFRTNSLFL